MPQPQFRRAAAADAVLIRDLTHRAYGKWVPVIGRPPKPMTADYHLAVTQHLIDLLVDGAGEIPSGIPSGILGLVELIPAADHWLIENVAVDPAYQGKGYGRVLVHRAEELTRGAGMKTIRLYTNKLFAENIAFYRKLGYQIDREEPFKGGYLVHMSKVVA